MWGWIDAFVPRANGLLFLLTYLLPFFVNRVAAAICYFFGTSEFAPPVVLRICGRLVAERFQGHVVRGA